MIQKCKVAIYEGLFGNKDIAIKFYNNKYNRNFFAEHRIWHELVYLSVVNKGYLLFLLIYTILLIWGFSVIWEVFWSLVDNVSEML